MCIQKKIRIDASFSVSAILITALGNTAISFMRMKVFAKGDAYGWGVTDQTTHPEEDNYAGIAPCHILG